MAEDGLSLQDIIRRRQRADFVGRDERLTEFGANLRLPPGELDRKFLFNIHGVAGVGKTFLSEQFRRVAERAGVVCAYADEARFDVVETMSALAADFAGQGHAFTGFDKRLATYRERRHELEADPGAPGGGLVTRSAVRVGLAAARGVPLLSVAADAVDPAATAEQVDRLRAYLSKKFRSSEDVRLLLSPAEVLTKVFLADLDKLAERHPVALFFDTFERTAPYLEGWLLDVLTGAHGTVGANVLLTIAGQRPLDSNRWSPFRGLIADIPLEPFTEAEARELLAARGVDDEETVQSILALSGRLPVWLATLAESTAHEEVADPSDSAVERFLKWEPDERRRSVALAGALPRRLNEDVLGVVGPSDLFDWLRHLPFVTETAGHWRYHDVARAPMLRLLRNRSPQRWREQHRRLDEYYAAERDALGLSSAEERWGNPAWQELILESCYHRLCANPTGELPRALHEALLALEASTTLARRWAAAMAAAGRDSGAAAVLAWGERLGDAVPDDASDGLTYLTAIIADGGLPPEALKLAHRLRGWVHREGERYTQAFEDYRAALRLDADYAVALAGRGETYRLTGDFEAAIADFGRAIELDPTHHWDFASRAETWFALDQYDKAIDDLDKVVELDPGNTWALESRGIAYQLLERFDEAIADFTRTIEHSPENGRTYSLRGSAYRDLDRHDEALADLDRAVELDPANAWAMTVRGMVRRTLGRHEDALADFTTAITLDPTSDWTFGVRAETYRMLDRHDEAIADFSRTIELDPTSTWAFGARAETYRMLDQYDEAIADFTRAIELDPAHYWAIVNRGELRALLGRHDDALADFTTVIELDPRNDWANADRGWVHLVLGHHDDAIASLTRAIDIRPHYEAAISWRGQAYLRAGQVDSALADFERLVDLNPKDGWAVFLRGAGRLAGGEADRAADDFRAAVNLGRERLAASTSAEARFNLAIFLGAVGEWDEATRLVHDTVATKVSLEDLVTFTVDLTDLALLPGIDGERVSELSVVAREAQVHPSV